MKTDKITVLFLFFLCNSIALYSQEQSKCISNRLQQYSNEYTGVNSCTMPPLLVNSGLFLKKVYNGVVRFYSDRYKELEQVELSLLDHERKLTHIKIELQYSDTAIFGRVYDGNSISFLDNEKKKREYKEVHKQIDKDLEQINKEQKENFITLFTCFCSVALPITVIFYLVRR